VLSRLRAALGSLPLILLVALLLRAGSAWNYQAHRPPAALRAIPFLFESGNIAYSLAGGHGFGSPLRVDTGPTAWMTPLYPLLLSAIMRIFGIYTYASWVAAVSMNICFSVLTSVPLWFAAKRIGGPGLASCAAWLWAVFPNAILLSYQSLWDTSLSALLVTTALWATLRLADSDRARDWAAYGLLWGIILMTNAAVVSLLPLFLGWASWRSEKKSPKAALHTALACGVIVLCCVPWTVRNYLVFHSFIPLRSTLGLQLAVGNNPDAKPIWLGEHHPINDGIERQKYTGLGEVAYMAEKSREAVHYMLTHPAHEARLIAGRFVMLWAGGSLHPLDDLFGRNTAWARFVLLFNVCAGLGALAAVVLLFREHSIYALPLAAGPIVFPIAYYLTLALPRYRHPIDPILMLLLGFTVRAVTIKKAASRSGGKRPSSEPAG
jgi:hypothetical protein